MRAHVPTLVVFSFLSLAVVAGPHIPGSRAATSPQAAQVQMRSSLAPAADAITGQAVIVDGDSLKINGLQIRLHGIDAPEMAQTCKTQVGIGGFKAPGSDTWHCGTQARRSLAHMIGASAVSCLPTALDTYGRTVAKCSVAGKSGPVDLNAEMVRQGLAWAFVRYSSDYVALEQEARAARRGIWQAQTQPAWEFRAAKWQAAEGASGVEAPAGCTIKGNVTWKGERIYHLPWSPWYAAVRMDPGPLQRQGKRWFCNEAEAQAAGWRPSATR